MPKNPFEGGAPPSSERKEKAPSRVASIELLGERKEQQDAFAATSYNTPDGKVECFLVVDGHGETGKTVARAAIDTLKLSFEMNQDFSEEGIINAFVEANDVVSAETYTDGATATCVLLNGSSALIGWVGNSEARVLSEDGLHTLTLPHEYGASPNETERLKEMGALIAKPQQLVRDDSPKRGYVVKEGKYLEVTRSLGDMDMDPYVLHEPQIKSVALSPDEKFLIVASDGLWNVLNDGHKRHDVEEALQAAKNAEDAKEAMLKLLKRWKLHDNTTILIVDVKKKSG